MYWFVYNFKWWHVFLGCTCATAGWAVRTRWCRGRHRGRSPPRRSDQSNLLRDTPVTEPMGRSARLQLIVESSLGLTTRSVLVISAEASLDLLAARADFVVRRKPNQQVYTTSNKGGWSTGDTPPNGAWSINQIIQHIWVVHCRFVLRFAYRL